MRENVFESRDERYHVPLPFVTGGIGLFLCYTLKGGLTGWQGFLIGFAVGVIALFARALFYSRTIDRSTANFGRCPNCGHELQGVLAHKESQEISKCSSDEVIK